MKTTWIGQAGLLIEADGKKILVDPYLSDSVEKVNPNNYRRVKVDESLFEIKPDIILLTHNHLDHTDPETLGKYLGMESSVLVLAPENAWQNVRTFGGTHNNYVMFNRGTRWTEGEIEFYAVPAEHSDSSAIGAIITYENKNYYISGDTLYNEGIFPHLPEEIHVAFLPINGVGNNMNSHDAVRFAKRIGAKKAVPVHFGMFDEINPEVFDYDGRVVPEIYKEIKGI